MKAALWALVLIASFGTGGLISSCAVKEVQVIEVTGASLLAVGATFDTVAPAINAANNAKLVSSADYARWEAFGRKFQAAYPLAVGLWKVADANQDAQLEAQVSAMIAGFTSDLAGFSALVGVK